jgi:hypothetical protein
MAPRPSAVRRLTNGPLEDAWSGGEAVFWFSPTLSSIPPLIPGATGWPVRESDQK